MLVVLKDNYNHTVVMRALAAKGASRGHMKK